MYNKMKIFTAALIILAIILCYYITGDLLITAVVGGVSLGMVLFAFTKGGGDIYNIGIQRPYSEDAPYRKVMYTDDKIQYVYMHLHAGQEIGSEVHPDNTQYFHIRHGTGKSIISGEVHDIFPGKAFVVPAGTQHNIIADTVMHLDTVYAPAHHPAGTVQMEKID